MNTPNLAELHTRWSALNDLATQLSIDDRRLSTSLDLDDPLVQRAQDCGVHLVTPLTIGTLLASVLGDLDGVEMAIEGVRRQAHPGVDKPGPLTGWERRPGGNIVSDAERNRARSAS